MTEEDTPTGGPEHSVDLGPMGGSSDRSEDNSAGHGLFDDLLSGAPIFDNKEVLRPAYTPHELPHRDDQINKMATILVSVLRGETPSNILIYGKTGTGKTASAKFVSQELERTSQKYSVPCDVEYINCEQTDTQYRVLAQLANKFIEENERLIDERIATLESLLEKARAYERERVRESHPDRSHTTAEAQRGRDESQSATNRREMDRSRWTNHDDHDHGSSTGTRSDSHSDDRVGVDDDGFDVTFDDHGTSESSPVETEGDERGLSGRNEGIDDTRSIDPRSDQSSVDDNPSQRDALDSSADDSHGGEDDRNTGVGDRPTRRDEPSASRGVSETSTGTDRPSTDTREREGTAVEPAGDAVEDPLAETPFEGPTDLEARIDELGDDRDALEEVPMTGWPTDRVYTEFFDAVDYAERVVVIMLDEIDKLVEKSGDDTLYNLSRMNSELEKSRVSIIGISNDLKFTDFLDPRVKSSLGEEEIVFPPYDANQLRDILQHRAEVAFKDGVLSPDVIPLCAAFAAQEHGDARRALDLLRTAGELCERQQAETVHERHVRQAQDKIELDRVVEVVRTLPTQSKVVLYAIILLERKGVKNVNTGEVYNIYKGLCEEINADVLTQRRVTDLISELDMLGIVNAVVVSKGRYGRTKEISLSVPVGETEAVLLSDSRLGDIDEARPHVQARFDT